MESKEPHPQAQPVDTDLGSTQAISERSADETLRLVEEHGDDFGPLTPEAERKLKRKTQRYLLFMTCFINLMLFVCRRIPKSCPRPRGLLTWLLDR